MRPTFASTASLLALLLACDRGAAPPSAPAAGADRPLAVVGANVVHPETGRVERAATVLVSGSRIQAVGAASEVRVPEGARVIDAHGKWVVPGYVDTHVHFFQSGNVYTRPDAVDLTKVRSYADEMARTKKHLPDAFRAWIASGVTSVVDCGGPLWNFEVREQARRIAEAPNVMIAGPLISFVDDPPLAAAGDPPVRKVTTADEAVAIAKSELARKPDLVKVWFIRTPGDDLAAREAIVKAVAEAAHAAGVRLAVHATELDTAKASLRAGADVLVHSVEDAEIDDEFIALARARHAVYVPTLFVEAGYGLALSGTWKPTSEESRFAEPDVLADMTPPPVSPTSPERVEKRTAADANAHPTPIRVHNLARMWREGFVVAVGTDAGNIGTVHGPSIFREMAWMAESGLTPLEVLRAATTNGAKAMAREGEVGDVKAGMIADLVVLDADPTADVKNLSAIASVVRAGKVYPGAR